MDSRPKSQRLLGLAARAGYVLSGETQVEKAIHSGAAKLVLIADDASSGTRQHFINQCHFYGVLWEGYPTRESLGMTVGKDFRSSAAVTDEKMAAEIVKQIEEERHSIGGSC